MSTKKIQKQVKQVQKQVQQKISSVTKTAGREMENAKDELLDLEKKVKSYIKNNPEKLFVAAAGIGAFVGALTATLLKKKKDKR
jgi:ElaB/YqjD/DUF883 family membrane-anchored ribosome-binding protein